MRKLVLAAAVAAAVPAVPVAQAVAGGRTISVGDRYFARAGDPPTVRVAKGTTVVWKWTGEEKHNVVVQRGPERFRSGLKDSGSFRHRLTRPGTYRIICTIHQPDMAMTLKVRR